MKKIEIRSKALSRISLMLVLSMIILPAIMITSPNMPKVAGITDTPGKIPIVARVQVSALSSTLPSSMPIDIPRPGRASSSSPHSTTTSATSSIYPPRLVSSGVFSLSSSTIGIASSFDALNEHQSCACVPPDVQVAAGPNHIVEMVNLEGEIFSKQGFVLKTFALASFFSTNSSLSDPKVLYDASSGRWFASIVTTNLPYQVLVAASASNDPMGMWSIYALSPVSGIFPDQPILGVNDDKVVLSVNDFNSTIMIGAQYWVLNKGEMMAGLSPIDSAPFGPFATQASVHPVQSLSSTTTEYMVSTGGETVNMTKTVNLFSITGTPPNKVTVSSPLSITVSAFPKPIGGAQPGTIALVDTNDKRVLDAKWFQGKLWFGLNTACTPTGDAQQRGCIKLAEINTGTSTLLQDFNFSISGQYLFYPSLQLDGLGDLDLLYGFSSSTLYPSLAVTGQLTTDAPNTLAPPKVLRSGSTFDSSARYGDYFGAAIDPSDSSLAWVAGEYHTVNTGGCLQGSCWSTFVGSISMKPDFGISGPNSAFTAGSSGQIPITLTSIHGSNGTVGLTATVSPSGPTVSLSPTSVTLSPSVTGLSTLTFSTGSSATKELYAVNVTGTSGSLTHTSRITVAVTPIAWTVLNSTTFTGVTVRTNGTLTINSPSNQLSLSGLLSITATNSSTGATLFTKTYTVTGVPIQVLTPGSSSAKFVLNIALSIPLSSNLQLSLSGAMTGIWSTVTRNVDVNGDGLVNYPDLQIINASMGCSIGNQCYNPRADIDANGKVDIGDLSDATLFYQAQDFIPNFSISATPVSLTLPLGVQGTSIITVGSVNGFSGNVTLSLSLTPTGSSASLNQTSVSLTTGASHAVKLTFSTNSVAFYTANVTATNGILAHFSIVAISIADFNMTTPIGSKQVGPNQNATFSVAITGLGQFAGTVSLTLTIPQGSTGSLSPTSVTLSVGGTASTLLTFSAPSKGIWTANVTGTSGSISHSIYLVICVLESCAGRSAVNAEPASVPVAGNRTQSSLTTVQDLLSRIASPDNSKNIE